MVAHFFQKRGINGTAWAVNAGHPVCTLRSAITFYSCWISFPHGRAATREEAKANTTDLPSDCSRQSTRQRGDNSQNLAMVAEDLDAL